MAPMEHNRQEGLGRRKFLGIAGSSLMASQLLPDILFGTTSVSAPAMAASAAAKGVTGNLGVSGITLEVGKGFSDMPAHYYSVAELNSGAPMPAQILCECLIVVIMRHF